LTKPGFRDSLCEGDMLLPDTTDTIQEEREGKEQANTLKKALANIVNKCHKLR
jgi:hypothetical protein